MLLFLEQVGHSAVVGSTLLGWEVQRCWNERNHGILSKLLTAQAFSTFFAFVSVGDTMHSRSVLVIAWMADTPDPWSPAVMISGKGAQRWY